MYYHILNVKSRLKNKKNVCIRCPFFVLMLNIKLIFIYKNVMEKFFSFSNVKYPRLCQDMLSQFKFDQYKKCYRIRTQ